MRLLIGLTACFFGFQVYAACSFFDSFIDNKNGTVTDPRNGLIWKRCVEGFVWNGAVCSGSAESVDWFDAMQYAKISQFLGKKDWRLPTRDELVSVVGSEDECKNKNYKKRLYLVSKMLAHDVFVDGHPGWFWSSTDYGGPAGVVFLFNGYVGSYGRGKHIHMRLVRSEQLISSEKTSEFEREYSLRIDPRLKFCTTPAPGCLADVDILRGTRLSQ